MRLKRLMSIVLAVALVMSFAMSASAASTLYYAQDFDYADITEMGTDALNYGSVGALVKSATIFDVATYRSEGKNILADTSDLLKATNAEIKANKNGNNSLYGKGATERSIAFITDESWDATATNQTETYVISLDYDPVYLSAKNGFANLIGYNSDASNYRRARILTMAAGSMLTAKTAWTDGKDLGLKAGGETKRVALSFKYDSTVGYLTRSVFVDDKLIEKDLTFDLANVTSIDGASFALKGDAFPGIGKLRMYTIDDDTEGFKVTADGIDDNKRVPVDTNSVNVTFTHPVSDLTAGAATFTLKKVGETEGTKLKATPIVTEGTVGGSYVSTATVTLPTLEEGADYEIVVTGVKNELGAELDKSTISFSTPKPDITTAAPTITNATVGAMSEASVAVSNNTVDESKTISVIYAVYNDAGALCDVVYVNDEVAANTTATISAGIKLGSDAAKVKAMVWDGLSNINPFTGFVSADVAAQ